MNFFYSTTVQITDYVHFYGYRPVRFFAVHVPASYTIRRIDVSRWWERIDWQRVAKMRDNGIRLQFALVKVTEGKKLMDPYSSRSWQLNRENGLLRGAYHYFSPSVAAPVQARLFLQAVDFSQGNFPAVLDVEERGKLSAKELRKRVSRWLKVVEKSTGKKPIIYSGAVFYHASLTGYFNEYLRQVAHCYRRRPDSGGMAWRFWRHSDHEQVGGINGPVGFNVFSDTVEGLQAFVDEIKETP